MSMLLILALPGTTNAAIWYVHPDSALNSIQAALDSCSTHDTVLVGPGTYYENIIWPDVQGIDLISSQGPPVTVIDGDSTGRVIHIASCVDSLTMVKGFTIQRGYMVNESGGGILCDSSSPLICDNIITRNVIHSPIPYIGGGGIACQSYAAPTICDNIISHNKGSCGAGIACIDHSDAVITNNMITDNLAWFGGGVYCYGYSSPFIVGNTISNNVCWHDTSLHDNARFEPTMSGRQSPDRSPSTGGGICIMDGSLSIVSNHILDNAATDGGGIGIVIGSSVLIRDNIISGNTATFELGGIGGAICGCVDSMTLMNNTIMANEAQYSGGGVFDYWGYLFIDSCTIMDNVNEGIHCWNCDQVTIMHTNISGNTVYGIINGNPTYVIVAENNWWGHATGPYHPTLNPGGMGDTVGDYVDFNPWLIAPFGISEQPVTKPTEDDYMLGPTIIRGPLHLPEDRKCRLFDITGRVVAPAKITRGVYFIEIEGVVTQKVVKIQ